MMPQKRRGLVANSQTALCCCRYHYSYNTGLQAQSVLYSQVGVDDEGRILLDPNKLSDDGTVGCMTVNMLWTSLLQPELCTGFTCIIVCPTTITCHAAAVHVSMVLAKSPPCLCLTSCWLKSLLCKAGQDTHHPCTHDLHAYHAVITAVSPRCTALHAGHRSLSRAPL